VKESEEESAEEFFEAASAISEKIIGEYHEAGAWVAECLEEFAKKQHVAFTELIEDLFHPVFAHMEEVVRRGGAPPSTLSYADMLKAWEIEQRAKAALWMGVPFLTLVTQWMAKTLDQQVRPYLSSAHDWDLFTWKHIGRWYNLTGEGVRKRFKLKDDVDPSKFLAGMRGDLWSKEAFSRWQLDHMTTTEEGLKLMAEALSVVQSDAHDAENHEYDDE
jgi:hypothetical protein